MVMRHLPMGMEMKMVRALVTSPLQGALVLVMTHLPMGMGMGMGIQVVA